MYRKKIKTSYRDEIEKISLKKTKTPSQPGLINQTHDLDKKIGINL
jgi:hypothetical protein